MKITLGELAEKLDELAAAKDEWERAEGFVRRGQWHVEAEVTARTHYEDLRDEVIIDTDDEI